MPLLAGDIGARGLPWRCFAGRDAGRTLSAQVYPSSCDAACAPGDFYWGKWIASQLEEKAMAEDSATQGTYDGSRDGIVSELGCYLHVRPGHAEDLRNAVREFATSAGRRGMVGAAEKIGVRTLRGTLFDNDTRFLFATTFDTDWDTYVDDAVEMMGLPPGVSSSSTARKSRRTPAPRARSVTRTPRSCSRRSAPKRPSTSTRTRRRVARSSTGHCRCSQRSRKCSTTPTRRKRSSTLR